MIEELKYTLKNIANRKLRSFLTVLSILIGITSIFALVSFGLGIDKYINEIGEEAGTDILYIMARGIGAPGTDDNFFITQKEIDFVDKLKGVFIKLCIFFIKNFFCYSIIIRCINFHEFTSSKTSFYFITIF